MRRKKLTMLRRTIDLVSAMEIWETLSVAQKEKLIERYVSKSELVKVSASLNLPSPETIGRHFGEFVDSVLSRNTDKSVVILVEDVAIEHNQMYQRPWDFSIREVRGLAIKQGKYLNVKHIKGGKIEVFFDEKKA